MRVETFSGTDISLNHPSSSDVKLIDIAWHLSNTCRFFGGCVDFYSVAQHSVIMSEQAPKEIALAALMHDAAEAYVGDNATPLKTYISDLWTVEYNFFMVIC